MTNSSYPATTHGHPSDLAPTYGRKLTYKQACGLFDGGSTRRLLENIAAGHYWTVAEDSSDGRQFDPQPLQAKKAAAVLEELKTRIAQLPDPDKMPDGNNKWDVMAQIMLLRINAESTFRESVTRQA